METIRRSLLIGVGQFDRLADEIREIFRSQSRASGRPNSMEMALGRHSTIEGETFHLHVCRMQIE